MELEHGWGGGWNWPRRDGMEERGNKDSAPVWDWGGSSGEVQSIAGEDLGIACQGPRIWRSIGDRWLCVGFGALDVPVGW
mmetsp:Transcript_53098/g.108254  ORF Transcript_53098/g.108254 Transcript_53098/m.108254 type:complete len:80 (+) Transcript_53098:1096-1335(+)